MELCHAMLIVDDYKKMEKDIKFLKDVCTNISTIVEDI